MKLFVLCSLLAAAALSAAAADRVNTANGTLEGIAANTPGVRIFEGIPYARAPMGKLRWREPQPVKDWSGVRKADRFGPRCMQLPLYSDMRFRSSGISEDCLYLNVWTPAQSAAAKLPVLVYFFGGGFLAGDGSEYRYDGESMASRGIVAVTISYRLNVFGFFSYPELTKESPHHASGNYGLLDQAAALQWVHRNIAAFGGDPAHVVIAGESAGSSSVSAQMASPLAKDLIAGAIGESGSVLRALGPVSLAEAEKSGQEFATAAGASSLAALRAMSAEDLLKLTKDRHASAVVDGYFLPEDPKKIFAGGAQAHVPLLAGWNSQEESANSFLHSQAPTPENYRAEVEKLYGDHAPEILKLYPGSTTEEVIQSATDLAGDRFIALNTWEWSHLCQKTGGQPVYRYRYERPRPPMLTAADAQPERGAVHSAEIEYAMGNLSINHIYGWTADDYAVSKTMQAYFENFIKTLNPNGPGLPEWPPANGNDSQPVMHINLESKAMPAQHEERYLFLEQLAH